MTAPPELAELPAVYRWCKHPSNSALDTSKGYALILPAGGGKTTLSRANGWFDIDDLLEPDLLSLALTLRRDARWEELNHLYASHLASEHWCTAVLAHSPEQLPPNWLYDVLVPDKALHESNISERPDWHVELSRLNRRHATTLHCERASTHQEINSKAKRLVTAGLLSLSETALTCLGCAVHTAAVQLQIERHRARHAAPLFRQWWEYETANAKMVQLGTWPGTLIMGAQLQGNTTGLGKAKTRVTLATLDGVTPLTIVEQATVLLNQHLEEHSVVSWLVWNRLFDVQSVGVAHKDPVMLRIDNLPQCKPFLDSMRLMADTSPAEDVALLKATRKMQTLLGRDLGEADWAGEREHSTLWYARRDKTVSSRWYEHTFLQCLEQVALTTVRNTYASRFTSMADWWAKRIISTPKGSSSQRHRVDKHLTSLHTKSDRAGKRVVYAYMPNDEPEKLLRLQPHCIARCSTKPEPGRKRRALYAACDCSTIIASWASHGLESAMRWGGMVARQTLQDVHEWLGDHLSSQKIGGWWLSLDYSDFNKEHRAWELTAVNQALARAWDGHPCDIIRNSKAAAARWTAESHKHRWATKGKESWVPVSGLFSGHRDTARDNTMLHKVYQMMQLRLVNWLLPGSEPPVRTYMCGDDEDTWFTTKEGAVLYYAVGMGVGWHYNPRKQMLSQQRHEFLQILCDGTGPPTQPLPPNVVAFVDGNWYKDPLVDAEGMAEAMMRVGLELINRGARGDATIRLIHRAIILWYKWLYKKHVRWDALLSEGLQSHPLLEIATPPNPPANTQPIYNKLEKQLNKTNPPAMQQAIQQWWPLLRGLKRPVVIAILNGVRTDAFRTWYTHAWNSMPPKPVLVVGKVPSMAVREQQQATASEAWDIGEHKLNAPDMLTPQKLAGILGVPLSLITHLDFTALARDANPFTAGYVGTVEPDEPNAQVAALQHGLTGSIRWLN